MIDRGYQISYINLFNCDYSMASGVMTFSLCILLLSDRTRITVAPTDQTFELGENVTFGCQAVSDRSTAASYEWYHNGSLISSSDDSYVFCDSSGALHLTTAHDKDGGMSRVGTYLCRVSNGYSVAEASANLVLFLVGLSIIIILLYYRF